MNIEETKKITNKIEGWLSDEEGKLLFSLAKNCKGSGTIVEVGSWKGKSTVWLGNGSKNGKKIKIYAIDTFMGSPEHHIKNKRIWTFEEFKKNTVEGNVNDLIVPLVKTSKDAAEKFNKPIELIFIDGRHEYKCVKLDFDLWFPKVINGGIMAFHDTTSWDGPKRVVKNFVYKSNYFKNIRFIDSITYAQKVRQNTLADKIINRYMLLLKDLYEAANKFNINIQLPKQLKFIGKAIRGYH